MDNKSTTKRMIGAVVLVLIAALLLAWLLKGKNKSVQEQQELIADQTQGASPILGFPGVNEDDKNADGQAVVQNGGDGAATEDGSYVIGAADQATDNAQQQAQNVLAAGGDAASSAGQAITDGANQVASAAATQANQAGQQVANATGFQVRDPQNQDGGSEQRPVVENGEVKAGTGSMGGNEVAATDGVQDQQSSGGGATQTATTASGSTATQSSGDSSSSAAQQTASAAGSDDDSAAKPVKQVANPKLVNEKPVPAPRTQSASSGNSSSGSASASSSSASDSSSTSASGSNAVASGGGYAIQVLAATKRSTAENLKKDIERDGYPVFVVRAKVNGKTFYRVRVGTYPAKGDARAVQTRMKARYTKNRYVQNSFVTKN